MKVAIGSLLVLTCLFVLVGLADDNFLWIGGINLSIGMKKDNVISLLSDKYDLKEVVNKDNYLIMHKGETPASNIVGQVGFKNNKLSFASLSWGKFITKDSIDMANALYASINAILGSGGKILYAKTNTSSSPEMTISTIELKFSNKTIMLTISDGRNVEKSIVIQENLNKN